MRETFLWEPFHEYGFRMTYVADALILARALYGLVLRQDASLWPVYAAFPYALFLVQLLVRFEVV